MPSFIGRWNALRPEMRPIPPARLLMTAVRTACAEVVLAGAAAGVDEAGAAHVPVRHLVAREVDGVVAGELGVDPLVELAVGLLSPELSAL